MAADQINPEHRFVEIRRTLNGWIVTNGRGQGYTADEHVARTPKELALLVEDWARAQGDIPAARA